MNKKYKKHTLLRLLKYILSRFKKQLVIIILAIIISSICHVYGQLFLQTLIDDYITPLIGEENPIYNSLFQAIGFMSLVYIIGILTTLLYSRLTVNISQGVLKQIRDDMFEHMETLPIR